MPPVIEIILATSTFAQLASPDSLAKSWSGEPGLWPLMKVLLLLVLVLGLVWISLSALRKVTGKGGGSLKGVEIIGGLPLGPRRSLIFVKIAGKVHIIGATDHHLTSIGQIDDPAEVSELVSNGPSDNMTQFKDILGKFTRQNVTKSRRGDGNDA